MVILIFAVSFLVSFTGFLFVIPRFKEAGIVGRNRNSLEQEEIAEMGGLVIVAGQLDIYFSCLFYYNDCGINRHF